MSIITFRFPTTIRYGAGARATLAEFAKSERVERPLLVTDQGLPSTEAYRLIAATMDSVWPGAWEPFSGVHSNPVAQDVEEAWQAFRSGSCDCVVAVGGGSALDGGKALRLKPAFPETPLAEIPLARLPARLVPMAAIPTTAGTGSEVGRSTVITISGRKVVIGASPLMPNVAILDAELTRGLPPHLTAATGMDALTHAIESYVCPMFHPMCDAIALEAIRLVRENLPRAVAQGDDLHARGRMLIAASMGAVAFQKDLGAAHSLAHPLSTEFGVHHGLANAIVLAPVVRFNGEVDSEQYRRVAEAMGIDGGDDPAARVASAIEAFRGALDLCQRLRDVNVPEDALSRLAGLAFADVCHQTNPRPCTETDLLRLYQEAW